MLDDLYDKASDIWNGRTNSKVNDKGLPIASDYNFTSLEGVSAYAYRTAKAALSAEGISDTYRKDVLSTFSDFKETPDSPETYCVAVGERLNRLLPFAANEAEESVTEALMGFIASLIQTVHSIKECEYDQSLIGKVDSFLDGVSSDVVSAAERGKEVAEKVTRPSSVLLIGGGIAAALLLLKR